MQISAIHSYQPAPQYPTVEIGVGAGPTSEGEGLVPRIVGASAPDTADGESPRPESEQRPVTQGQASVGRGSTEEASELRQLQQLKSRDREVRAHEAAHLAAGASIARGGMTFTFQRGPDGVMYAVGGEVSIDTSRESTPEATLQKAETIRRAALAPAEPSSQDRFIAARATQMAAMARVELAQLRSEEGVDANPSLLLSTAIATYRQEDRLVAAMPGVDERA